MTTRPVRVHLIAGGRYHDIDYARLALLERLAAFERVRTTAAADYESFERIGAETADFLVTYTCDVTPGPSCVAALQRFLEGGGRWLALHGTNSILTLNDNRRWEAPADESGFMALLGSQFAAHPPIAPYTVHVDRPDDPLARGLGDFVVEGGDELYYMRMFGEVDIILSAKAQGAARGFVERDWPEGGRHPVLYRKRVGAGGIVYFTLGHRRGHYDMAPLMDYYPEIEKGAWEISPYQEILRRCIAWGVGEG